MLELHDWASQPVRPPGGGLHEQECPTYTSGVVQGTLSPQRACILCMPGFIAQLGERKTEDLKVTSSILVEANLPMGS